MYPVLDAQRGTTMPGEGQRKAEGELSVEYILKPALLFLGFLMLTALGMFLFDVELWQGKVLVVGVFIAVFAVVSCYRWFERRCPYCGKLNALSPGVETDPARMDEAAHLEIAVYGCQSCGKTVARQKMVYPRSDRPA
jgi:hypothetical protein